MGVKQQATRGRWHGVAGQGVKAGGRKRSRREYRTWTGGIAGAVGVMLCGVHLTVAQLQCRLKLRITMMLSVLGEQDHSDTQLDDML